MAMKKRKRSPFRMVNGQLVNTRVELSRANGMKYAVTTGGEVLTGNDQINRQAREANQFAHSLQTG